MKQSIVALLASGLLCSTSASAEMTYLCELGSELLYPEKTQMLLGIQESNETVKFAIQQEGEYKVPPVLYSGFEGNEVDFTDSTVTITRSHAQGFQHRYTFLGKPELMGTKAVLVVDQISGSEIIQLGAASCSASTSDFPQGVCLNRMTALNELENDWDIFHNNADVETSLLSKEDVQKALRESNTNLSEAKIKRINKYLDRPGVEAYLFFTNVSNGSGATLVFANTNNTCDILNRYPVFSE